MTLRVSKHSNQPCSVIFVNFYNFLINDVIMPSLVSTGNCKLGHDCRRVCSHRRRDDPISCFKHDLMQSKCVRMVGGATENGKWRTIACLKNKMHRCIMHANYLVFHFPALIFVPSFSRSCKFSAPAPPPTRRTYSSVSEVVFWGLVHSDTRFEWIRFPKNRTVRFDHNL